MRNDGSFLPVWSEFGRRLALTLVSAPRNAQLLEHIANARGLFSIGTSLARYQPSTFRVLVTLFAVSGFMVPAGVVFLGLRVVGRCGGQRIQVITPLYNELYNGHCVALGSLTISAVIVNVLLVGFAFGIQKSLREASNFYDQGLDELEGYFRAKYVPEAWNRSQLVLRSAALQAQKLDADFSDAFEEYLLQRLDVNPFASRGPACGKLLRAMLDESHELLKANCSILEQTQQQLVENATQMFKKKTVAERRHLARALRARAFKLDNGGNTNLKMLSNVKVKLRNFENRFRLRQLFGYFAPLLMMTLAMVVGVVAALLVVALAMGMINHDRGMAPTMRNAHSNRAGLIMLYSPAALFFSSLVAVPLAGVLLSGCVVGECYICEPYRGRERHILDEAATKLLSGDKSLVPSKILHSCTEAGKRTARPRKKNGKKRVRRQVARTAEQLDCTANCTRRGVNGSADVSEILQPVLSDFYEQMLSKTEIILSRLGPKNVSAVATECRTVYKLMNQGYSLFCGSLLGNYHGAWSSLLVLAGLMMATAVVSLRLSRFHLVMEQYCYAGWDDRILRKSPRRRRTWAKRHQNQHLAVEEEVVELDSEANEPSSPPDAAEGAAADAVAADAAAANDDAAAVDDDAAAADDDAAAPKALPSDSEEEPGSMGGGWHSEAWLLGSLNKDGSSPSATNQAAASAVEEGCQESEPQPQPPRPMNTQETVAIVH